MRYLHGGNEMSTLTALFGIGLVIAVCAIIGMWSQWPDRKQWDGTAMNIVIEQADRIGTIIVMVETLLDTTNDAINTLNEYEGKYGYYSNTEIDTAISNLVWARDYVLTRMAESGETLSLGSGYPHNPDNYTCPGQGIKCVCWDLDRSAPPF
jgi:DMSO/TMAO reductase YedYZ molybdopterin-dependent catalytic subunit